MKHVSLLLLALPVWGEPLSTGNFTSNRVAVRYETRMEPDAPAMQKHGGGTLTEKDVVKRHVCNFASQTYFGYDLVAKPLGGGLYELRFAPLSLKPRQMGKLFQESKKWKAAALPGGAVTRQVRAGETVVVDLFVDRATGQKITDHLTVMAGAADHESR